MGAWAALTLAQATGAAAEMENTACILNIWNLRDLLKESDSEAEVICLARIRHVRGFLTPQDEVGLGAPSSFMAPVQFHALLVHSLRGLPCLHED
jgi:hypothetical protein